VRHVVDLSGEPESWWGDVTRAVEASRIAWTHLWPGDFMENTLSWVDQIRATGAVREPYPMAASTPVAMDDIAAVAARVLLDGSHVGRALPLSGPELLTRVDLVRLIGAALGRDVAFIQVSRDEAVAALADEMGDDAEWYVDTILGGFAAHPPEPTSTVAEVVGRPAMTFARWARDNADRFR
jgi:uncharacterized protein YbjT (DUF2867 family)